MRNYNLFFSLASLAFCASSVEAFASMKRTVAFSNTAIRAEVDDMPAAEIPAIPDQVATPEVTAVVPDTAAAVDGTAAKIIQSEQFTPPSAIEAIKKAVDPDAPQPLPVSPVTDLDTIALVAGQENYGLAIVLLGEAIWSFSKAPSVDHALKTLLPAIIAAVVLGVVSGPMVTSGDAGSVGTGLSIATGVSIAMGACYAARLSAPFSPSPKEIPALGLVVAFAGFFSFSQNLVVDGFVTLPSLPTISLPSLPSINLPF
mmetsp:Transcript_1881/g.4506  ORF Transcript_1881/g.4506 Transcript_1881/m.4506 type:complete len:258 (+) Transcript_1881:111-884(+)